MKLLLDTHTFIDEKFLKKANSLNTGLEMLDI